MPTITRHDLPHAPTGAETRVAPPGRNDTPLPSEFPYLRPPQAPGELGRLGGYRVLKLLGSGGMGKVFLAEDVALKRAIALKVMCLPPGEDLLSWRERFLREARAQAGTRHPNLVTVFQVGEDRGTVFIAMELLEGETLEARIRRAAPLPIPEARTIAEDVLRGLSAIHAHGLIHRDIKPANIWLTDRPTAVTPAEADPLCFHEPEPRPASVVATPAKILDFGLVREVRTGTQLTEAGAVVGTPAYMSPEQARGRDLDHRTDLFSFGCVLYAAVTGRPPFLADTPMAQAAALAADDPVPARKLNRDVPPALSELIADLLAKEPDDRPASADDVLYRLQTLDEASTSKSGTAPRRPLPRESGDDSFRRRYAVMAVAAVCVVVAVLAAVAAAVSLSRDSANADKEKDKIEKADKAAPKPAPPKPPAKPPEPPADYLVDMPSVWEIRHPPLDRPVPAGLAGPPLVGGAKSPRSLHMHPTPAGADPAQRAVTLGKAYTRFVTDLGFADSADRMCCPVTFVLLADGHPVWQSRPQVPGNSPERIEFDVRNVHTLTLSTAILGPEHRGAHAVWIEPRLIK